MVSHHTTGRWREIFTFGAHAQRTETGFWLPHKLIVLAAVAGLMAGLVTTRVVLSGHHHLACNALLHEHVRAHFRLWLKNRNAMLFLGYFLICPEWFYSENLHAWWSSTQNKLPLLAIPFDGPSFTKTCRHTAVPCCMLLS